MKIDKLTKFIIRCLLAFSLGGVGQVHAYLCNISLEANPPFPETIASTQVVGTVIYQGNLTWRFSGCVSENYSGSIILAAGGPQPSSVWGVSGLTVEGGNPQGANYVNTGNFTFDAWAKRNVHYGWGQTPVNRLTPSWQWGLSPKFDVTQPITIKASATTVSGNFPDPSRGSFLQDMDAHYKERCTVGPWLIPDAFSACSHWGGTIGGYGTAEVGEPQIALTPAVPRIVSGSAASEQNCKPVLRSSITIPNLKNP